MGRATVPPTIPTHTYQTNGLFTVSLWVTDDVTTEVVTRSGYVAVGDGRVIEYVYDELYRLTEANYSSGEKFEYAYDAVGNRTTYTATLGGSPQVTGYQYDDANRLVNAGGVDYTWYARGNLRNDGAYTYTWNAAGRLITVTDGITTLGFLYPALCAGQAPAMGAAWRGLWMVR